MYKINLTLNQLCILITALEEWDKKKPTEGKKRLLNILKNLMAS